MSTNYIAAIDPGSSTITIAVGAAVGTGAQNGETVQNQSPPTSKNVGLNAPKLTLKGVVTMPMQGIARGEIDNRQLTLESVRAALEAVAQQMGVHISEIYLGTSGRNIRCAGHEYFVFVSDQADGEIRAEDVAALNSGMHNVQAEDGFRILDRIPQRYIIDGRETVKDPVGRFGKKVDATFNFVLGSTMLLDRLEKTLLSLGVKTRKTVPNAIASAEAVLSPEEKEMGVAVVDLGAGTTDVCVWEGGVMRYVRGIPFGAGDIDNDIKQQGMPEKHAEGLKKELGKAMVGLVEEDKMIGLKVRASRRPEISLRNLSLIIEQRMREIIDFVMAEIADAGFRGGLRGGIVLTGGGSLLSGVDELFRDATGMDVRLGLPDVWVDDNSLKLAQNPAHSAAIGLLLKALDDSRPAVVQVDAPARKVVSGSSPTSKTATGTVAQTVVQTRENDPEEDADDDSPTPKKHKKEKKEGGGNIFSRWFDGFLREPLSDDEDI